MMFDFKTINESKLVAQILLRQYNVTLKWLKNEIKINEISWHAWQYSNNAQVDNEKRHMENLNSCKSVNLYAMKLKFISKSEIFSDVENRCDFINSFEKIKQCERLFWIKGQVKNQNPNKHG